MPRRPLPAAVVRALDAAKIMGIKAGAASDHRFTGVWPIVIDGRVFARSWTSRRDGWHQTFLDDALGELQAGDRVGVGLLGEQQVSGLLKGVGLLGARVDADHAAPDRRRFVLEDPAEREVGHRRGRRVLLRRVEVQVL